jgi:integrase
MAARRSYGTGGLFERSDGAGRVTWYGSWYAGARRVKRRIGPKRVSGTPEGLTRSEAERELRRLMAEVKPSIAVGEQLTIGEVARRYVRDAERRGRKPSTCTNINSEVRHHLEPFFRGKALDAIRPTDVEDLVATLEGKGLAPKSVRNIVATLSSLFTFAMRRQWATSNACAGIELPAVPCSQELRFLTLEQVDALVAHVPEGEFAQLDATLFLTAALTGMRKGELLALRWEDVDWPAQRIRVRRNHRRGKFGSPKSGRARSVPMTDEVAGALDRLYKASSWQGQHDLVFAHPATGGVIPEANISRRMRRALKAAGLDPSHRFHDLRHTFATRLASQGVPMRSLQEMMGHADYATTLIYSHYAPATREAEMIAQAFARGSIRGTNLSEPDVTSEQLSPANMGVRSAA